ncbi:MAG: Flp pilus assembly complex ATPase component TadA [Candidatus Aenigmarchaeota archaeon]|nr:Flp pilus assembly complex ATPase component TadA [Candidatus Aenigmarchaeota archaeon]
MNQKLIVPDTSILIQGKLSQMIREGKLTDAKIIIPVMVLDELQAQASRGKEIGFEGLEEIKKIRDAGKEKGIAISFTGRRPTMEEINLAKKGRIDALIRDVASEKKAKLLTSDYVQALVAEVEGIQVEYIPQPLKESKLVLEDFFTPDTQSVHLKEGTIPLAKRGKPGEIKLVKLRDNPIEEDELKKIIDQIVLKARSSDDGFIEMSNYGSLIIQLGNYRISIARPPFSDATEVTAVRPIAKVNIADYKLHAELEKMLADQSVGVLIAGPPGSGKSTFAASIADMLVKSNKIVKTFEQPRDLQVGPEVTQYAPLDGSWEKTAEILLLVRPDYTIFDEIRKTHDFRVFSDMRLAGVGMIGVMHATDPINSIQRFIGRVELGVIPHVIDVVIFIKAGKIEKVYELALTVKVPHGMMEADLARPVVEIKDFETKKAEYEIYSYGEENVVIPIGDTKEKSAIKELAKQTIFHEIKRFDHSAEIEVLSDNDITVRVRNDVIPAIIGKGGSTVESLEKKLGLHINIEPKEKTLKHPVSFIYEETGGRFNLLVDEEMTGEQVDIYSGEEFLLSPTVGKEGKISIKKNSDLGTKILQALASKRLKIVA